MSTTLAIQDDLFTKYVSLKENGQGAIISKDITWEAFEAAVNAYGQAFALYGKKREQTQFILGDLFLAGEAAFGERYSQAMDADTIDEKLLTRATWVCRTIPPEQRHAALTFSHHEVVAGVKDSLQRDKLLVEAEKENLTVAALTELRKERIPSKRDKKPSKPKQDSPQDDFGPLTDETAIGAIDDVIDYLKEESERIPIKQWPPDQKKRWAPRLKFLAALEHRLRR